MTTYADIDTTGPIKPYFLDQARAYFRRLGGDPEHAGKLAAWAQHWREDHAAFLAGGGERDEADVMARRAVLITEGGDLVADVFHVYDDTGRSRGWYIDKARLRELGVDEKPNDARLASPAIERTLGERVSIVTLRDVAFGPGAAVMSERMPATELRARRELLGLTEEAFGAAVGELRGRDPIRKDTVHRWESGREPVPAHMGATLESLEDMAAALVDEIRADPAAWSGVTDATAAQRTGRSWATARWVRHAYARAITAA